MHKLRVLVLASGGAAKGDGGSGFQEMVEYTKTNPPILNAEIVGVITNHPNGGVYHKACSLEIPCDYWQGPYTADGYRERVRIFDADYVMCSGWLFPVSGLNPATTLNIHPGDPLRFGGKGLWGHHVHDATMAAYHRGEVKQSAVAMHFVTDYEEQKSCGVDDPYDKGPIIAQFPVLIRPDDTPVTLAKRVNEVERVMQSRVLNLVIGQEIWLSNNRVVYTSVARRVLSVMGGMSHMM